MGTPNSLIGTYEHRITNEVFEVYQGKGELMWRYLKSETKGLCKPFTTTEKQLESLIKMTLIKKI